ncbi:MAG: hypothetical protein OJF47_003508 [Nitrospira sp.]|nr:MAG: hypothetical protein OJF47_003508 [Nitrospira sp.]
MALPTASSARLFTLLPIDLPAWDLNSIARTKVPLDTTIKSHFFVALK